VVQRDRRGRDAVISAGAQYRADSARLRRGCGTRSGIAVFAVTDIHPVGSLQTNTNVRIVVAVAVALVFYYIALFA
jgi:hypothetical protein